MAESGLVVADIGDPENMGIISTVDIQGTLSGLVVSNGKAFLTSLLGWNRLVIVDISDLENPEIINSIDTPADTRGVAVSDGKAFVAAGCGLRVVDISNPENLTIIGSADIPGYAYNVAVSGGKAFIAAGLGGLVTVPLPMEIDSVTVKSQTGISLNLPSPESAGHYTLMAFNGEESHELYGAVTFEKTGLKCDFNGNGKVDLADAVIGLKILTGMKDYAVPGADVNGDNRIGLEEVVYILDKVIGLRNGGF